MKRAVYFIALSALFLCGNGTYCKAETQETEKCRMIVASFNLRMNNPGDGENAWPKRKELAKALIQFHDFDIFGTQEGFKEMLDGIAELPQYAWIGEGRDGGDAGEHSAIFYKKDRFTLLENGDFWYSETPEKVGKGWDAKCCNRICSWGKFKDNVSGKEFYFFNSHFDHEGETARRESAKLLLAKIKEIAGNGTVFSTGDYNATPESEPIRAILADGLLKDSYVISKQPPYGTLGTYNGFGTNKEQQDRIDHIFVTKDVVVLKYGVLNELPYGKYPSDHFPVMDHVEF